MPEINSVWPISETGAIDEDTIERIDVVAPKFVDAVYFSGTADIEALVSGMAREHLIGLAISISTLAEPSEPVKPLLSLVDPTEGWSIPALRVAHADFQAGDRRKKAREGERIYQRISKRQSREKRAI